MHRLPRLAIPLAVVIFVSCSSDVIPEDSAEAVGQSQAQAEAQSQLAPSSSPISRAKLLRTSEPIPGQYIVVLKDGRSSVASIAAEQTTLAGASVGRVFEHALRGYVFHGTEASVQRLLEDPRVKYVEENGIARVNATQTGATWGIDRIDQRFLPLSTTYTYNATGAGVNAYIIDTGIRITHAEFGGRAVHSFTSVPDGNGANDCHGHGTHVAGTVGGTTYGVAKMANLYAVRVLDCGGSGTWDGVIAGIDWVTANRTLPAVANMSLGGAAMQSVDDAVTNSITTGGVVYAIAAGNGSADACGSSPARTPLAITVGATETTDVRASYSNYGTCLDIFAPGTGVTSAWNTSDTATNTISGTSMATPHVAGAAALYLGLNPTATPGDVEAALEINATPDVVTSPGTGSPNIMLYSGFIGGGGGGDTTPPVAEITAPADGTAVAGTVQVDAAATDDVGVVSVSFYVDGTLVGSDSTEPYSRSWDSSNAGNGNHVLGARAFDAAGNISALATVTVSVNNPGQAAWDPVLQVPRCATVGPFCDSGTMINGRAGLGPELNTPNTINDSCLDGTVGSYHVDESMDRLKISTLDGSALAPGKQVRIDATVWWWGGGDALDLYYAANASSPVWTYLTTLTTTGSGTKVLSATYTLPTGELQAIRGNFRYQGSSGSCTAGSYDDRDDLVFAVGTPPPPPAPVASFTETCPGGLECNFTDTSTHPGGGTIVGWTWDFGDGGIRYEQNPLHAFPGPGTYTVTLTVVDSAGQSGTASHSVTVQSRPPVASFSYACTQLACSFTDSSTDPDGILVGWSWSFGDGSGSTDQSTLHTFNAPGTYSVTLTVTNYWGQTGSATQAVTVTTPAPTASFVYNCNLLGCGFNDTSTDPSGTIVGWAWSFGDGSTSTNQGELHQYSAPGTYSVTLTVTSSSGLTGTTTQAVTVSVPAPTASFLYSCNLLGCGFNDTSSDPASPIVSWSWSFGDGSTSTNQGEFHQYSMPGTYTVTLTVTNFYGLTSTATEIVTVSVPAPTASFVYSCNLLSCGFNDTSTDPVSPIVSWSWSFGDGSTSTNQGELHQYSMPGTYAVTLTVTNFYGLTSTATQIVTVSVPAPTASFVYSCNLLSCGFNDTSTDPVSPIVSWSWSFGDGSTSTNQGELHQYSAPGTYTVTLTVTNFYGLTSTATQSVTVTVPPPSASFVSTCNTLDCSFMDTSSDPNSPIASWSWSFGDGSTFTGPNPPLHSYTAPGTYNVTLTVTNGFGLSSTVTQAVTATVVPPVPSFAFSCGVLSCSFADTSTNQNGSIVSWSWSFGDGTTSSAQNPAHAYALAGTYNVTLTVTNSFGLSASVTQAVAPAAPVLNLTAVGSKVKNQRYVDLTWSGATSTTVQVYRNGTLVLTTGNDGSERTTGPPTGRSPTGCARRARPTARTTRP